MEGQYAQQQMPYGTSAPFFYYHPDAPQDTRQQGHFASQPQGVHYTAHEQYMSHEQMVPLYAANVHYQKTQHFHPMAAYSSQPLMTPVASPQPIVQKPNGMISHESPYLFPLDTDCYTPSTPPLSSSGSAISSPPSTCDILPTPVSGFPPSRTEGLEGVKQGCEEEVYSEILAGSDLSGPNSPAMTPGK